MTAEQLESSTTSRLKPVDLLRGLLIVLMALDHANYHIAQQHSSGEYWGGFFPTYTSSIVFLTRFVTHLSAPGFFFLLGTGMILFRKSRLNKGWTKRRIRAHFTLRGAILISAQIFIVYLGVWSVGTTTAPLWYVGVLAALGAGMIVGVLFLDLTPGIQVVFALLFFATMELLTPASGLWGRAFSDIPGVLLIYGGGQGNFWVNYPLLAWIEVILLGMAFGGRLVEDSEKTYRLTLKVGVGFLLAFLIFRAFNGFGNLRPYQLNSWVDFLNLVKYPPSMTFILLTMGINLLLLRLFSLPLLTGINKNNPLIVFGRVPLFSYLVHLAIYAIMGRVLTPQGSNILVMYALWLLGLVIMYPLARWYGEYKGNQQEGSWVRFL